MPDSGPPLNGVPPLGTPYVQLPEWLLRRQDVWAADKVLWAVIHDRQKQGIRLTLGVLAQAMGHHRAAVRHSLRRLRQAGLVMMNADPTKGGPRENRLPSIRLFVPPEQGAERSVEQGAERSVNRALSAQLKPPNRALSAHSTGRSSRPLTEEQNLKAQTGQTLGAREPSFEADWGKADAADVTRLMRLVRKLDTPKNKVPAKLEGSIRQALVWIEQSEPPHPHRADAAAYLEDRIRAYARTERGRDGSQFATPAHKWFGDHLFDAPPATWGPAGSAPEDTAAARARRDADVSAEHEIERARCARSREIDAILAALPAAELERLTLAARERLPANTRRFFGGGTALTNSKLRAIVWAEYEAEVLGEAIADQPDLERGRRTLAARDAKAKR